MLSISTSWMPNPKEGMASWFKTVKELGFDAVELSYRMNHAQLEEAVPLLKQTGLKVSSIHNFCPTPDDEPSPRHPSNYYRMSSLDDHERKQAVKWTNIAIDTASRVGAGVVVIHAGVVDVEDDRSPELFGFFTQGQMGTDTFIKERDRILNVRKSSREPYLKNLLESLNQVADYARKKNVKIGLETRYYPLEIPNFDEIQYFLDRFDSSVMGYWHDVGHAEINSRLGIKPHKDYLEVYKDRLIGVHLHGIAGRKDHQAPFEGDMKLETYLPYFKNVIRVVECKPYVTLENLKASCAKLKV